MELKPPQTLDVRSVFISDTHIGYFGSDLWSVVDFLRRVRCRYLFLNGDIVDSWKLEQKWSWPEPATLFLQEIAIKFLTGTKVIFLPGNHDDLFREIDLWDRENWARHMGLQIRNTHVHKTIDGKRWLVLHGDQFDTGILRAGLSRWSDKVWVEIAQYLPMRTPDPERRNKAFSLARELAKKAGKKALALINRFEQAALRRALLRATHGVICGHTHIPVIKTIGNDVIYANSGMWQGEGKNTALIEDWDGAIKLVAWERVREHAIAPIDASPLLQAQALKMAERTKRWVERTIRKQR